MDSATARSRSRSSRADFGDSVRRDHGAHVHQLDQRGGGRPRRDAGSAGGRARMQYRLGDRRCGVLPDVECNRARTWTPDPARDPREPRSESEPAPHPGRAPGSSLGGADSLGGRRASRTAGATTRPAGALGPNRRDLTGAFAVFLLVFLSTLPISLPFLLFRKLALRCGPRTRSPSRCCSGWGGRWASTPADRAGEPGSPWSASDWYSSPSRSRWADESAGFPRPS